MCGQKISYAIVCGFFFSSGALPEVLHINFQLAAATSKRVRVPVRFSCFSVQNRVRVFFPFSNVAGVFFVSSSRQCVRMCVLMGAPVCVCVCVRFVMLCEQEKLCGAFHLTWLPKWQLAGKRGRGNNNYDDDDDNDGDELRTNICIMCQGEPKRKSNWRQQQDTTHKSMQFNGHTHKLTHTKIFRFPSSIWSAGCVWCLT